MKILKIIICLLACSLSATAQKNGGISTQMLHQMEKQYAANPSSKALFNAIASNSIDDLAKNFKNQGPIDTQFSTETPKQSIHDQKQSGRCWMFSGLNVLRSNFAKQHKDTLAVEFSQDYLFFYDQLEKVANLIDKYGLVPKSIVPETYSAENTSRMARLISSKLREFGLELYEMAGCKTPSKTIQERKAEMLSTIYNMLCLTLGEPVKEFTYAFTDSKGVKKGEAKLYTPKSFYQETVGGPINGSFIMVMNDPRRPYHKTYEVEYDRHTYDGHNWKYLNLPMEDISALAIASLKDGRKMYSSYDVGKQLDRKRGYVDTENFDYASLFNTTFNMSKAQRIATFDSGSTHAMTLSAVDIDADGKPRKWKVENSWGEASGQSGCIIMTDRWFKEYMFRLVIDKQYVSAELLKEAEQKPVMVMPEDPLFDVDE